MKISFFCGQEGVECSIRNSTLCALPLKLAAIKTIMKKRRPTPLQLEQLEARETPDVSLGHAGAAVHPPQQAPAAAASRSVATDQSQVHSVLPGPTGMLDVLPMPGVSDAPVIDSQALEHLFFSSDQLDQLLSGSGTTGSDVQLVSHAETASAPSTTLGQNLSSSPADSAFTVNGSQADTEVDQGRGWKFLSNYALKAIRNDELRYGPLKDHDDILQQTFVEWRQGIGNQDQAFTNILNRDSPERLFLRKAVRRVIDRARYEQGKQQRVLPLMDQPAPVRSGQQEWLDLQIDWAHGPSRLDPRERQLLELRRQGKTFEEIGADLGMAKQRVFEIYSDTIERLQERYSADGVS
jgi:Sigma-70, region 4